MAQDDDGEPGMGSRPDDAGDRLILMRGYANEGIPRLALQAV